MTSGDLEPVETVKTLKDIKNLKENVVAESELEEKPKVSESEESLEKQAFQGLDYQDYLEKGTQALALGNFETAAENLSLAVEKQVKKFGQTAPECGSTFYLYGKALLGTAVIKNSVLGEKGDKIDQEEEEVAAETEEVEAEVIAEGSEVKEAQDQTLEEDVGQALEDIEAEEPDDLELAWENLDVARLIYSKDQSEQGQLMLADVHVALGDVSLESENFEQAVGDYNAAIELKSKLLPPDHRERAEAHYKLALALEYSEQLEQAIENVNASIAVLQKKLESLRGSEEGKGKTSEKEISETEKKEIEEIEALFPEMEAKLADLAHALEKEEQEGVIGEASKSVNTEQVQDISNLVKKRKDVAENDDASKKSKVE